MLNLIQALNIAAGMQRMVLLAVAKQFYTLVKLTFFASLHVFVLVYQTK